MRTLLKQTILFVTLAFFTLNAAHAQKSVVYVPNTFANISNILLATGVLDIDDPVTMDEYVRIHQCGLFEQYGADDFAWARIREAQRRELKDRLDTLPTGLEISSGLMIDQYDFTNGAFRIKAGDVIKNVGVLEGFSTLGVNLIKCEKSNTISFDPYKHPLNVSIRIQEPINLYQIPVERQAADKLIDYMKKTEKRVVSMVVRVRIISADPDVTNNTSSSRKHVLGNLHDIRFYEGPERKLLLHTKTFETPPTDK